MGASDSKHSIVCVHQAQGLEALFLKLYFCISVSDLLQAGQCHRLSVLLSLVERASFQMI